MGRAIVRWRADRWIVETDGVLHHEGDDQIDAEVAAVQTLEGRGGELLIRDARGRQLKRLMIGATG